MSSHPARHLHLSESAFLLPADSFPLNRESRLSSVFGLAVGCLACFSPSFVVLGFYYERNQKRIFASGVQAQPRKPPYLDEDTRPAFRIYLVSRNTRGYSNFMENILDHLHFFSFITGDLLTFFLGEV